jgi:hypothetical protein
MDTLSRFCAAGPQAALRQVQSIHAGAHRRAPPTALHFEIASSALPLNSFAFD